MWCGDIGGAIRLLFWLAVIGLLCMAGGAVWGAVWLIQHVRFV